MKGKMKLLILLVISILLCMGCEEQKNTQSFQTTSQAQPVNMPIVLSYEGPIPLEQCEARNLQNNVIVIHSKYCKACAYAIPLLKEIESEKNIALAYIDISESHGKNAIAALNVQVIYTPTIIAGCNLYTEMRNKKEYEKIIDEFLKN